MIIKIDDWGTKRIHIDEPLPGDFAARLLKEMLQIARPYGASHRVANAVVANKIDIDDIVAIGLRASSVDFNKRPHPNDAIHFDYVGGLRIKVSFLPNGTRDHDGKLVGGDPGLPVVRSRDFDDMYGDGALEAVVRLALM